MTLSSKFNTLGGLLLAGSSLVLSTTANAQSSGSIMVDVGPCIRLESAIQRFACYEQQVENTLTGSTQAYEPLVVPGTNSRPAPAAPAPTVAPPTAPATVATPSAPPSAPPGPAATAPTAPPPAPAVAARDPEASFGMPAERQARDEIDELHSTIAALRETVPNSFIITLENGQVWRQVFPESNYRLQVGHAVRIYPSRWGDNYRLSAEPLRGFIQVERIE